MQSITSYNGLNGVYSRNEIETLIELANKEEQPHIATKLSSILSLYPQYKIFDIEVQNIAVECIPESVRYGLEEINGIEEDSGLCKAVSPNEIYQKITDLILNTIKEVGHLPWQKEWAGSGLPTARNYVTEKPYTGINAMILPYEEKMINDKLVIVFPKHDNVYYLTFNQIEKLGARLKKGAKSRLVTYYNFVFVYDDASKGLKYSTSQPEDFSKFAKKHRLSEDDLNKNLSRIPVLKYYRVFNAKDCDNLPEKKPKVKQVLPNLAAEKIIELYPNSPKILLGKEESAFYRPGTDSVYIPKVEAFKTEDFYYSTFFHELIHSTGHHSRLDRTMASITSSPSDYAFEELIAELGAVFLCSETGILFKTIENSAKYLKGWHKRLSGNLEKDNKFFFKAAAAAQKGSNYILNLSEDGIPAYVSFFESQGKKENDAQTQPKPTNKTLQSPKLSSKTIITTKKNTKKPKAKPVVKITNVKRLEEVNPKPFANKPKSVSVQTAIKDILETGKYKNISPLQASLIFQIYKNDPGLHLEYFSEYQEAILKKLDYVYLELDEGILTDPGKELVQSIQARLESLRNQKTNYALFDGLKGQKNDPAWFPEYSNFQNKPKEAIKHLLKVKKGNCKKALFRKDIGFIDIPWGENNDKNKGFGLKHIVEKHGVEIQKLGFNVEDFIPIVILFGEYELSKKSNRILLQGKSFRIVLDKKNDDNFFVLTAFDLRKKRGLQGCIATEINFIKLREHIKMVDGDSFTIPPLYGKTLTLKSRTKITSKINTKKKSINKSSGQLAAPIIQEKPNLPIIPGVTKISDSQSEIEESVFFNVDGQVGYFLQGVEKKPFESVVITMDGEQGAGKTTTLYHFLNAFANPGNKCLFISGEEHYKSHLAKEKIQKYLSPAAQSNISITSEVKSIDHLYQMIEPFDIIFIDSWQKLQRMVGSIKLDEDLRKRFDSKVFVIIFQQTTTGRTKGGAEVVFDGDIIIKMVKGETFADNYAYFDKNRYTNVPIETLRYNIANGEVYNPYQKEDATLEEINLPFQIV